MSHCLWSLGYFIPSIKLEKDKRVKPFYLLLSQIRMPFFSPLFLSFLSFLLSLSPLLSVTRTHTHTVGKRECERESCCYLEEEKERKKRGFLEISSSLDQLLQSTSIRSPIKLKFCKDIHDM